MNEKVKMGKLSKKILYSGQKFDLFNISLFIDMMNVVEDISVS